MHKGTALSQPGQRRGSGGTALTLLEVEVVGCLGRPESHGVHSVVLVSRHWGVVRHGKDNLQKDSFPLWLQHSDLRGGGRVAETSAGRIQRTKTSPGCGKNLTSLKDTC